MKFREFLNESKGNATFTIKYDQKGDAKKIFDFVDNTKGVFFNPNLNPKSKKDGNGFEMELYLTSANMGKDEWDSFSREMDRKIPTVSVAKINL